MPPPVYVDVTGDRGVPSAKEQKPRAYRLVAINHRGTPTVGKANMNLKKLKWVVTSVAIGLAILHIAFPKIELDIVTMVLLVVAVLPWLAPLFKSVELPGGVKIELQDLKEATDRVKEAGLLNPETKPAAEYSFQAIAAEDPNLALAGVRIELEKRLRQLAAKGGYEQEAAKARSVKGLMFLLSSKDLIRSEEFISLEDLIDLLNKAVHGAEVDPRASQWALDYGRLIIKTLEDRAKELGKYSPNRGSAADA
jgi:hypothetical protein